jgi:hypothetical protein
VVDESRPPVDGDAKRLPEDVEAEKAPKALLLLEDAKRSPPEDVPLPLDEKSPPVAAAAVENKLPLDAEDDAPPEEPVLERIPLEELDGALSFASGNTSGFIAYFSQTFVYSANSLPAYFSLSCLSTVSNFSGFFSLYSLVICSSAHAAFVNVAPELPSEELVASALPAVIGERSDALVLDDAMSLVVLLDAVKRLPLTAEGEEANKPPPDDPVDEEKSDVLAESVADAVEEENKLPLEEPVENKDLLAVSVGDENRLPLEAGEEEANNPELVEMVDDGNRLPLAPDDVAAKRDPSEEEPDVPPPKEPDEAESEANKPPVLAEANRPVDAVAD